MTQTMNGSAMARIKEVTTAEVNAAIGRADAQLVDVRDVNAYNGWRIRDEHVGGHIRGARSLWAKWAGYMDWIEIVRSKGIRPEQQVILYGYDRHEVEAVAARFLKSGYNNIAHYPHFLAEWQQQHPELIDRMARWDRLVPAQWVKAFVDGKPPRGCADKRTVIVHAHYRNRDAYLSGHIPGAIDMDTLALEAPETWNRRSPAELKRALEAHGITADTRVILYGKYMSPDNADEFPGSAAGHLGAIRCNLIMLYAGVKNVHVLNGGFRAWTDAGFPASTDDVPKKPVEEFGAKIPVHPEYIVDIEEAKRMIAAPGADLVSVRSWPEFIGEVSGYNYIGPKGRIPGAVFGNCGSDAYHMENYRNLDHTVRESGEVVRNWKEAGIVPEKKLAFFCGTGWRGSEAFYNAWLLGWPKVSVYDGGWFEWSADPNNPVETGVPATA